MEQPILPFANQYKKYTQSVGPFMESPTTKNYSTVIFFFLVLSVFGWYAIRPTIQTILYLQREIKDKTALDKKMDDKIYALIEANSAFENNLSLFPVLADAVPTTPEALDLVSQIQKVAENNGIALSTLKMSEVPLATPAATTKPKNGQRFAELPITFSVEGSYLSIVSFLRTLISMRRIVSIDSMSFIPVQPTFASATDSGKTASIKVTMKIVGYYETK